MIRSSVTMLLVTAFIAGCAEVRWHKAGTDAAALEKDLDQCRQTAQMEARHETLPRTVAPSMIATDPQGRPIAIQPIASDSERFLLEQDLTRHCMRGKGYELVPAEKR
jgi:hypothetical protein